MTIDQLKTSKTEPSPEQLSNLAKLLDILNEWESLYGQSFKITSGFRSWSDHKRIYQQINDQRLIAGKPDLPIPLHSAHLDGNAADIYDPNADLKHWISNHLDFFEDKGIYFEAFSSTPNWVHAQRVAPKSGNRFFEP